MHAIGQSQSRLQHRSMRLLLPYAGELDLDAQLQHHKKQKAAAAPKHPDDMQFGERMRYELVNSFIQVTSTVPLHSSQ